MLEIILKSTKGRRAAFSFQVKLIKDPMDAVIGFHWTRQFLLTAVAEGRPNLKQLGPYTTGLMPSF